MKYKILGVILLISCNLSAQLYFDAKNINVSGIILKNGFGINAGFERMFGTNENAVFADISYEQMKEKLRVKNDKAQLMDIKLLIGYRRYVNFMDNISVFGGVGFFGGYEQITNKNKLPETVIIERKDGLLYGPTMDLGAEYFFKSFTLFGTYRPKYEIRNKELTSSFLIGIKFYIEI